jgi:hypothetical protein
MKYTSKRAELEDRVRAELGVDEELGTFDWKDMLFVAGGVALLAYIIIRSIF